MHYNYRRKNRRPSSKKAGRAMRAYSLKPMRQAYWRQERARAREAMVHGRFEALRDRHPDSIYWEFW